MRESSYVYGLQVTAFKMGNTCDWEIIDPSRPGTVAENGGDECLTLDSALAAATQYATTYAACHWMERFMRVVVLACACEDRYHKGFNDGARFGVPKEMA